MESLKDLGYKLTRKKHNKTFKGDFLGVETTIEIEELDDIGRIIMVSQDTNKMYLSETEIKAICEELKEE